MRILILFFFSASAVFADSHVTWNNTSSSGAVTVGVVDSAYGGTAQAFFDHGVGHSVAANGTWTQTASGSGSWDLFYANCSGVWTMIGTVTGSHDITQNVNGCGGPAAAFYVACVDRVNASAVPIYYTPSTNGVSAVPGGIRLEPGQRYTQCWTNSSPIFGSGTDQNEAGLAWNDPNGWNTSTNGPPGPSQSGPTTPPDPNGPNPTGPGLNGSGTNGNFYGTNLLTVADYNKGINQVVAGQGVGNNFARAISNGVAIADGSLSSIDGRNAYITNVLAAIRDNTYGDATNGIAMDAVWRGMSNRLASIDSTLTNSAGSSNGLYAAMGLGTNAGMAFDAGSNGVRSVSSAADTANGYGGAVTNATGIVGSGSAGALSFGFCGTTLNLDPEARFPGFMTAAKAVWTFILLVGFGSWVSQWFWEASARFSTAQTGGVPSLDVSALGFGGNALGLIVALVVPFAIIAIWVAALTSAMGLCLGWLGLIPSASSALGLQGNATALYLLNGFFPVSLALGLISARITIPMTGAKLFIIAGASTRFLFGR